MLVTLQITVLNKKHFESLTMVNIWFIHTPGFSQQTAHHTTLTRTSSLDRRVHFLLIHDAFNNKRHPKLHLPALPPARGYTSKNVDVNTGLRWWRLWWLAAAVVVALIGGGGVCGHAHPYPPPAATSSITTAITTAARLCLRRCSEGCVCVRAGWKFGKV